MSHTLQLVVRVDGDSLALKGGCLLISRQAEETLCKSCPSASQRTQRLCVEIDVSMGETF